MYDEAEAKRVRPLTPLQSRVVLFAVLTRASLCEQKVLYSLVDNHGMRPHDCRSELYDVLGLKGVRLSPPTPSSFSLLSAACH